MCLISLVYNLATCILMADSHIFTSSVKGDEHSASYFLSVVLPLSQMVVIKTNNPANAIPLPDA